jgi:hypothetical protein
LCGSTADTKDIRTIDLLRFYKDTGVKVPGPMEIRCAWFFNDLKPRIYYTNGGDSFFNSLYITDIANLVCKFLPSTNPDTRFEVTRVGSVREDQILVTYDYSSFTSSLSELKYFMFYLGYSLYGVPVDVYDPFEGVVTRDLGALIRDYNDFANHFCGFSVERFDGLLTNPIFHMGQSGALGIKGNIVFSTSVHGLSLAAITGNPDGECCVGDDALAAIMHNYIKLFMICVNNLGDINESKFNIIKPISSDILRHSSFKFLKRPLDLDSRNIPTLGILDFFPDVASLLFPEGDNIHTSRDLPFEVQLKSFVTQLTRFFTLQSRQKLSLADEVFMDDEKLVLNLFRQVYKQFGLPETGAAPGLQVLNPITQCYFELRSFVPPIDTDVILTTGWVELCFSRFGGSLFEVPYMTGHIPPPEEIHLGQEFFCSSDVKPLVVLRDLGYLESDHVLQTVTFDQKYFDYLMTLVEDRDVYDPTLIRYTVVQECNHYHDLIQSYLPEDSYDRDVMEELATVASVYSEE